METTETALLLIIGFLAAVLILWAFVSSLVIVQEYEVGLYMRLGRYRKNLAPGIHFTLPFVSRVYRVDKRVQTLETGRKEVMTRDLSPTLIEAVVQYQVVEPQKCLLKVDKFKSNLSQKAHSVIREMIIGRDLDQVLRNQRPLNMEFKNRMIREAAEMGIRIETAEFKEIDPVGPVKAAIEDRIAAEKERQAMILRADGRRKALLMEAEGRSKMPSQK